MYKFAYYDDEKNSKSITFEKMKEQNTKMEEKLQNLKNQYKGKQYTNTKGKVFEVDDLTVETILNNDCNNDQDNKDVFTILDHPYIRGVDISSNPAYDPFRAVQNPVGNIHLLTSGTPQITEQEKQEILYNFPEKILNNGVYKYICTDEYQKTSNMLDQVNAKRVKNWNEWKEKKSVNKDINTTEPTQRTILMIDIMKSLEVLHNPKIVVVQNVRTDTEAQHVDATKKTLIYSDKINPFSKRSIAEVTAGKENKNYESTWETYQKIQKSVPKKLQGGSNSMEKSRNQQNIDKNQHMNQYIDQYIEYMDIDTAVSPTPSKYDDETLSLLSMPDTLHNDFTHIQDLLSESESNVDMQPITNNNVTSNNVSNNIKRDKPMVRKPCFW
jgi:hypothetical protein